MKDDKPVLLHGTAVLLPGGAHPPAAVFLRGLSGSGKSDLAFRLIGQGAHLICDDQVSFSRREGRIMVSSVEAIHGLLEVRGVGLIRFPAEETAHPLHLVVDLVRREEVPRLPEWKKFELFGLSVPLLALHAFDVSAAAKVFKAMEVAHQPDMMI